MVRLKRSKHAKTICTPQRRPRTSRNLELHNHTKSTDFDQNARARILGKALESRIHHANRKPINGRHESSQIGLWHTISNFIKPNWWWTMEKLCLPPAVSTKKQQKNIVKPENSLKHGYPCSFCAYSWASPASPQKSGFDRWKKRFHLSGDNYLRFS